MNCYFFRNDKKSNNNAFDYESISYDERIKIYTAAKELKNQLDNIKKGRVFVVCDDNITSLETSIIIDKALDFRNSDVFVDERLNEIKTKDSIAFGERIETKAEYKERVFNAMAENIMSHANEDIVIFVSGEHLFKLCQKDEDIHSLMYFGDEFLHRPISLAEKIVLNDYISDEINNLIIMSCLESKKQQKPYNFEKVVLETPAIDKNGQITPVYLKYAKQKNAQEENKQRGE